MKFELTREALANQRRYGASGEMSFTVVSKGDEILQEDFNNLIETVQNWISTKNALYSKDSELVDTEGEINTR